MISIFSAALYFFSNVAVAENIEIEFTEDDSDSIEIARIQVGYTIEWLPKNEGHNVEFLAGPEANSLPPKSKIDEPHSVVFESPGVCLYGCTHHANMGMLGPVIVYNDLHNLESIK
jgi:plastocyanin